MDATWPRGYRTLGSHRMQRCAHPQLVPLNDTTGSTSSIHAREFVGLLLHHKGKPKGQLGCRLKKKQLESNRLSLRDFSFLGLTIPSLDSKPTGCWGTRGGIQADFNKERLATALLHRIVSQRCVDPIGKPCRKRSNRWLQRSGASTRH